jgi:hypothetical protein
MIFNLSNLLLKIYFISGIENTIDHAPCIWLLCLNDSKKPRYVDTDNAI